MLKLTPARIKAVLAEAPNWKKKGAMIARTYEFKDFVAAMKFVNAVAKLAEQAWHHPDIDIRWNKVTLALTTHSKNALTQDDVDLASVINQLAPVDRQAEC